MDAVLISVRSTTVFPEKERDSSSSTSVSTGECSSVSKGVGDGDAGGSSGVKTDQDVNVSLQSSGLGLLRTPSGRDSSRLSPVLNYTLQGLSKLLNWQVRVCICVHERVQ